MALVLALLLALAPQAPAQLLELPSGWRGERIELPLSFAPELELEGFEQLAFAPGMFVPDSDSYFSYAFAFWIEEEIELDESFLEPFLETYYRGLCRTVAAEKGLELALDSITVDVRRDGGRLRASVAMFDAFTTGAALDLELELETRAAPRATELLGLASPLDAEAPVWKELHGIAERWRGARSAALLNHVYFVVDRETYDALASSEFLRSFAVMEERETRRADGSYSGLYFYGRRTYFEFLPPGAAGLAEGSTGLALGLELAGATEGLAQRLGEHGLRAQALPITREHEGEMVPWFRLLGLEMPSAPLTVFTMEYDPLFLARWHAGLPPLEGGSARSDVLERYAAFLDAGERRGRASFGDVREVRLALDGDQRERLLTLGKALGYELEERGDEHVLHAPQFRLVLRASATPGGVTGIELALRRPLAREPLELGKARLSFHARGASLDLRP